MNKAIVMCLCICGLVYGVYCANRIVAKEGGEYTTITDGLKAAVAGDTVLVKAGIYNEIIE